MWRRYTQTQRRHRFSRLLERHTGLEPRHAVHIVPPPLCQVLSGPCGRHPNVDIARGHEIELARHDADHFVRSIIQNDLAAQHVARTAETPLPEPIANDRHPHALRVFLFSEDASEQRLCAKDGP